MKLQMDKPVHTNPSGHKENLKNREELFIRCSKVNETINHVTILIKTFWKLKKFNELLYLCYTECVQTV